MSVSSPLRQQESRGNILPDSPLGSSGHSTSWVPNEELVVSDVFAPQTPECEEKYGKDETSELQGEKRKGSAGLGVPSSGFRMRTPKSSPARRSDGQISAEKSGAPGEKQTPTPGKARRQKKKRKAAAERLAVASSENANPSANGNGAGGKSNIQNDSSKMPSSTLTPLAGSNNNPGIQSNGGVSALKQQLERLNLTEQRPLSSGSHTPSGASGASDSDQTEILTTYEVPLEHDFISTDADSTGENDVQGPNEEQTKSSVHRKMTANDFEPLTCLGKGSFGTVLLVRHKVSGVLYAQKQFRKASLTVHKSLVEQTKTERAILESVNRHPFVVKLFYAFQDHEKLYLILEYAQGGELFTHLAMERMFTEEVTAFYMAEMVLALEHLHQSVGVIYRDLKPENCLLDAEGHLILTDFGLSKIAVGEEDRCNSSLGTIEYMAPEVIQRKHYGKACDWWSLGALGYDLLTGSPPFKGNNHTKIMEKIQKQKLVLPYYLGPDAKDLFTRLLRKEPHKRLGYHMPKDMRTIKSHRFFRNIDWKALENRELEAPIKPVVTDPERAENFSPDFTSLPLSPMVSTKAGLFGDSGNERRVSSKGISCRIPYDAGFSHDDPFGGFSFVASSSLLESEFCLGQAGW